MEREIKTVLTTVAYDGWHWDKLADALYPAKIIRAEKGDKALISEALKEADAAILGSDLDDQILEEGKKLKWIHCDHAGLNFSARPEIFERGIMLTGSAGRSGPVLAEHTFFLALSLIYKIHELSAQQKAHIWGGRMYVESRGLYSKTMGIIGMGFTGKEVAKRAKVFGMKVLGYDRDYKELPEGVDEMFCADRGETIEQLLRRSDVAVLSVRLSDETYHMVKGLGHAGGVRVDYQLLHHQLQGPFLRIGDIEHGVKIGIPMHHREKQSKRGYDRHRQGQDDLKKYPHLAAPVDPGRFLQGQRNGPNKGTYYDQMPGAG